MDEWRQCLSFASKWHKLPLQAAYKLWQESRMTVPAPPANQWKVLSSGQPMTVKDQVAAEAAVTPVLQAFLDIDMALTTVHEKFLLMQAGAMQFSAEEKKKLEESEAVYQEFKTQCLAVEQGQDGGEESMAQLVESFKSWAAVASCSEGQGQ